MRNLSLFAVITAIAATPTLAQERAAMVDVPAMRLDQAIRLLGSQTGSSIGFRDPALGRLRSRAVRGRYTVAQALEVMLQGSEAAPQRVAPATFLIKRAPPPPRIARPTPPRKKPPKPRPRPAPPPEVAADEIVVTGTKRDIPLGSYAGSIQIIDGSRLSKADGARGSDAIESRVASVASTHQGQGRNKLFIRGIADSSFVGPTQATVGQYWGNSRIAYSAPDPSLRLYDVQSIEVLEGPQGTLYGAGSLGGVVRVVPHAPDMNDINGSMWSGVQAVRHGQPGTDGGGLINIPIVEDRLAVRAVAFGAIEGGYIDDAGRGLRDVNDVKSFGGRLAVRYAPSDDWTLDINAVGQRIDGEDSQYAERGDDKLSRTSSVAQPYRNDFWLVDMVARKQWDDLELTTSLGYARQYVFEQFDGVAFTADGDLAAEIGADFPRNDFVVTEDGRIILSPTANAPTVALTQANRIRMFTSETRLSRRGPNGTGWLFGASLLDNEASVDRNFLLPFYDRSLTGVRNRVREATLYGEASFEPVPRMIVTYGGRLTYSRLTGHSEYGDATPNVPLPPSTRGVRSETRVLPSASVAYRTDGGTTLFARYQQGFRPGGIAVRRELVQRFKGDRVETIEAGMRYTSPSFNVTASGSWTNWRNIQADVVDGYGFPTTVNVGNGRIWSIGAAARWAPTNNLELDAALYLNRSKVTDRFPIGPLLGVDGKMAKEEVIDEFDQLPNIADVTGRIGFTHSLQIANNETLTSTGFARYVGKSTLGVGPILGMKQGDYVDTGLEFRAGNSRRGVSLSISNLLDTRGNRFALGSPFLVRDRNAITPLQPRTIRLGLEMTF